MLLDNRNEKKFNTPQVLCGTLYPLKMRRNAGRNLKREMKRRAWSNHIYIFLRSKRSIFLPKQYCWTRICFSLIVNTLVIYIYIYILHMAFPCIYCCHGLLSIYSLVIRINPSRRNFSFMLGWFLHTFWNYVCWM